MGTKSEIYQKSKYMRESEYKLIPSTHLNVNGKRIVMHPHSGDCKNCDVPIMKSIIGGNKVRCKDFNCMFPENKIHGCCFKLEEKINLKQKTIIIIKIKKYDILSIAIGMIFGAMLSYLIQ